MNPENKSTEKEDIYEEVKTEDEIKAS